MKSQLVVHHRGMLTIQNVTEVAGMIEKMLRNKKFTVITMNELFGWLEERIQGQRLAGICGSPPKVEIISRSYNAHLIIHGTYGIFPFLTRTNDETYDRDFKNPYFILEGKEEPTRVTIFHRTDAGDRLIWKFEVEEEQ